MNFLLLVACHFIGDFPLQQGMIAQNKGKSWQMNFYHAAIYSSLFVIAAKTTVLATLILMISHFLIDPLKCRWHIVKHLWMDQILHLLVIGLIAVLKL